MFRFKYVFVFFFKQKTAYEMRISDWSSDVCSSDLRKALPLQRISVTVRHRKETGEDGKPRDHFERLITLEGDLTAEQRQRLLEIANRSPVHQTPTRGSSSEERRVGKEGVSTCGSRGSVGH